MEAGLPRLYKRVAQVINCKKVPRSGQYTKKFITKIFQVPNEINCENVVRVTKKNRNRIRHIHTNIQVRIGSNKLPFD